MLLYAVFYEHVNGPAAAGPRRNPRAVRGSYDPEAGKIGDGRRPSRRGRRAGPCGRPVAVSRVVTQPAGRRGRRVDAASKGHRLCALCARARAVAPGQARHSPAPCPRLSKRGRGASGPGPRPFGVPILRGSLFRGQWRHRVDAPRRRCRHERHGFRCPERVSRHRRPGPHHARRSPAGAERRACSG